MMETLAAYGGMFFTAFLAATVLPAQSEILFTALLASGRHDPLMLGLVATAGNTLGSVVNWVMGRFAAEFRDRRWFPLKGDMFDRACRWYQHYGIWSLLFAWLPFFGDPLTVVAGALRVDLWRFVVLVTIGKAARYAAVAGGTLWWVGR